MVVLFFKQRNSLFKLTKTSSKINECRNALPEVLLCLPYHTRQQFPGGSAELQKYVKSILENTILAHSKEKKKGDGERVSHYTLPSKPSLLKKGGSETGKRDATTTMRLICSRISHVLSQSLFLSLQIILAMWVTWFSKTQQQIHHRREKEERGCQREA